MNGTARALVLRTAGTNCDGETMHALRAAGAAPDLLHIQHIFRKPNRLFDYSILVIPGGFSYGDDVAAGRILANELKFKLGPEMSAYIAQGRLLIGVCNGFQALVKTGFLPDLGEGLHEQQATLANNDSRRFQCEWVRLKKEKSRALWLSPLAAAFELPIAHGEGRFLAKDNAALAALEKNRQVVFRYAGRNPNGSARAIAGICNPRGNVVGLMPHPERYVTPYQHPAWGRNGKDEEAPGKVFWQCAVDYAKKLAKG